MKLGLAIEYAGRGVDVPIELIQRCEAMGYDSVWTAEAYGSDAITPLAFIAAHTRRIRLGTGVIQLSARTPTMTAMQLGTVDALAGGGRVIGGLGVSGPQIVEGWFLNKYGLRSLANMHVQKLLASVKNSSNPRLSIVVSSHYFCLYLCILLFLFLYLFLCLFLYLSKFFHPVVVRMSNLTVFHAVFRILLVFHIS